MCAINWLWWYQVSTFVYYQKQGKKVLGYKALPM